MGLENLFWGATQSIQGTTYLYDRATVNVQEGYNTGNSLEYVNLGDYDVESFNNDGTDSQSLSMRIGSPINNLRIANDVFDRRLYSGRNFYDDFSNIDTFDKNYKFAFRGGAAGPTTGRFFANNVTSGNLIVAEDMGDVSGIMKFGISSIDAQAPISIFVRASGGDEPGSSHSWSNTGISTGIEFRFYSLDGPGINALFINRYDAVGATALAGRSYGITNSTYWAMFSSKQQQHRLYLSTDGRGFTKLLEAYETPTEKMLDRGRVIVHLDNFALGGDAKTSIYSLDLSEIANQYTLEDSLEESLGMGKMWGASIESILEPVSSFLQSAGSSWTISGEQVNLNNSSTGSSWHTFMSPGISYIDVVFEGELKGTSGNYAGILYGRSTNWYGNFFYFGPSNGSESNVEHWLDARFEYQKRGGYIDLQPEQWYKFRMVKTEKRINWYINDILSNSIVGTSLNGVYLPNQLGVFGWRTGISGSVTSFRNLRIPVVGELVNDLSIGRGTNAEDVLVGSLSEGVVAQWSGGVASIFNIGSSRAQHGVSASSRIYSMTENTNNNAGTNVSIATGENFVAVKFNPAERLVRQVDQGKVTYIENSSIDNLQDGNKFISKKQSFENTEIRPVRLSFPARVELETNDQINVILPDLGVSGVYIVANMSKDYDGSRGKFIQNVDLMRND